VYSVYSVVFHRSFAIGAPASTLVLTTPSDYFGLRPPEFTFLRITRFNFHAFS
jgi:hypothetical protein